MFLRVLLVLQQLPPVTAQKKMSAARHTAVLLLLPLWRVPAYLLRLLQSLGGLGPNRLHHRCLRLLLLLRKLASVQGTGDEEEEEKEEEAKRGVASYYQL